MATKTPRVNVTFEDKTVKLLSELADKKNMSMSKVVKNLVLKALKYEEDIYFSSLAEEREKDNEKTIKHEDAWA